MHKGGTVAGSVQAKLPGVKAKPPPKTELASVCPKLRAEPVDVVVIFGVSLLIVMVTKEVTALKLVVSLGVNVTE